MMVAIQKQMPNDIVAEKIEIHMPASSLGNNLNAVLGRRSRKEGIAPGDLLHIAAPLASGAS
jgi:hypothetical protein